VSIAVDAHFGSEFLSDPARNLLQTVIMAPITRSAARKTFKFSSLPTELRLMIWNKTFEPRILHITSETITLRSLEAISHRRRRCIRLPDPRHILFKSREKPPIALQICHESRTLALKRYTPSFHSMTSSPERASEMKQTALYFNPELDTIHIVDDERGSELWTLYSRTQKETIQSIKTLAIESHVDQQRLVKNIAALLPAFEVLETLILVIDGEAGKDEEGFSVRERAENILIQVAAQLKICREWKLPMVKVMNPRAFKNNFKL
jgi:hypothetical protein